MTKTHASLILPRRRLLQLGAVTAFSAFLPRAAVAAGGRDARFITVVLHGGMDGLDAVPAIGDPDYMRLRGPLVEKTGEPIPLDGFFALHPAMPELYKLYRAKEALIVHAAASPYRDRSHFDGQDVLESGLPGVGDSDSGWLNRMMQIQGGGEKLMPQEGLVVGVTTPLILRGAAESFAWAPSGLSSDDPDLPLRLMALYGDTDPQLAQVCAAALRAEELAGGMDGKPRSGGPGRPDVMEAMALGAAKLMARDDGPRVGAMVFEGWDTHKDEGAKLPRQLGGLDKALAAFKTGLGPVWKDTAILVVTEFGRTAAMNGTGGTDHGTATVAILAGGAVNGGRVIADWPGLKPADLFETRDLKPTTDLRAVAKGVIQALYDTPDTAMATDIFPESATVRPISGLII